MAAAMLLGCGLVSLPRPAAGQECRECTMVFREVVRIGDREGPGALVTSDEALVRTDSRDRYFVSRSGGTEILVFDAGGRFVRTLGRRGEGPGEFMNALSSVVMPGDSLFVFDNVHARLTVFGPDLGIVRMARFVPVPGAQLVRLDGRRLVTAISVATPQRAGYPLHVFDTEGNLQSSFGSDTRMFGPGLQQSLRRAIAYDSGQGVIWSAHIYRYEITAWDTTNVLRGRILREVDWFPPRGERPDRPPVDFQPPEPSVQKLWADSAGNLWVALHVADERWRDAIHPDARPGATRVTSPMRYWDSIVEVIDRSGRLISSARIDGLVTGFLPEDRIVVAMEDQFGFPYISIQSRATGPRRH